MVPCALSSTRFCKVHSIKCVLADITPGLLTARPIGHIFNFFVELDCFDCVLPKIFLGFWYIILSYFQLPGLCHLSFPSRISSSFHLIPFLYNIYMMRALKYLLNWACSSTVEHLTCIWGPRFHPWHCKNKTQNCFRLGCSSVVETFALHCSGPAFDPQQYSFLDRCLVRCLYSLPFLSLKF